MQEEEQLKTDGKGDTQEAELLILDEFAVLCRDLYAFYPMLIRYVDNNRYEGVVWKLPAALRDWFVQSNNRERWYCFVLLGRWRKL